jgi:hypothetical protein
LIHCFKNSCPRDFVNNLSQEETLPVQTETALWHIAMPVVGAVHSIKAGHCDFLALSRIQQTHVHCDPNRFGSNSTARMALTWENPG